MGSNSVDHQHYTTHEHASHSRFEDVVVESVSPFEALGSARGG